MKTTIRCKACILGLFIFSAFYSTICAQVGIGTTDPKTMLDVNGAISLREGTALALATSNNNDIDLSASPYSVYRITASGNFGIRNIVPAGTANGQLVTLINTSTFNMTIRNNTGGTAANRIRCPNNTDVEVLGQYSTATLQYNAGLSRWVLVGTNGNEEKPPIDSVTLAADYSLAAGPFSDVPAMSLSFVARKTSVLVMLSGSGDTSQLAAGIGDFEVVYSPSNVVIGGTHEKLTTFDDIFGITPAWGISFTKPITGLTIGTSYTIKVRALFDPFVTAGPNPRLRILPVTSPGDHHLTLSVMQ